MAAAEDRLSNLPEHIILHIISLFPKRKQIVKTCVLSKPWRFLWKSVPLSLRFNFPVGHNPMDLLASAVKELDYWKSCQKILTFRVLFQYYMSAYTEGIDKLVHFATKVADVECFTLELGGYRTPPYELGQCEFTNSSLRNLVLCGCRLNLYDSVNWSSLISLSMGRISLNEAEMENVLFGCPNLEFLELDSFWGIHYLEINSEKLKKLIIKSCGKDLFGISAPYVQDLQILGSFGQTRLVLRNVASLVNAVLDFTPLLGLMMERKKHWR